MADENESRQIHEIQSITTVRCGDARDDGSIEPAVIRAIIYEYIERGIRVQISRVTTAGVAINNQSYIEIKDLLKRALEKAWLEFNGALAFFEGEGQVLYKPIVRISGHADFRVNSENLAKLAYNRNEIGIVDPHSPVNCGMRHASEVWTKIIELLYEIKPERRFFDHAIKGYRTEVIDNEDVLFPFLKGCYAHDDTGVESFLRSIDILRQPRTSKNFLRNRLNDDIDLVRVPCVIHEGLINYRTGQKVRLDDSGEVHTALDDIAAVMYEVVKSLADDHPEKLARSSRQNPSYGLICSPYIDHPRETLVKYVKAAKSSEVHELLVAGSVFLVTGMNVSKFWSSFGPYKLGGICYSIMNLGIRNYYIIGKDDNEATAIERKMTNDPILSAVLDHFGVQLHKLTLEDIKKAGVDIRSTGLDMPTQEIIRETVAKMSRNPHPKSPLGLSKKTNGRTAVSII